MDRRRFLTGLALGTGALALGRAISSRPTGAAIAAENAMTFTPLEVSRSAWKALVPPERYRILFREGTEPPRSSPLDKFYDEGTYTCAACYLPLFTSDNKFDSGTGWPSFTQPIDGSIATKRDFKLIVPRTEYHCARCGGHQGHVFKDGPPPTGQRWCNNGLALEFTPRGEALPALRAPS
ncbi:MAG: peptide-methionine (R)-S-oxide reductase MsrB [Pseudomonadota bacterium]